MEEFEQDQVIYPLVEKLDKLLDKNKTEKIEKVIKQLEELLLDKKYAIPVSYILSILAENNFNLISESVIENLENYIDTNDPKLKVNTFIIIGFAMLSNKKYLDKYYPKFITHLGDFNKDLRDNIYYFLQEIGEKNPTIVCTYKEDLINALLTEDVEDNIVSILCFLEKCIEFDFEDLFALREVLKSLIKKYFNKDSSKVHLKVLTFAKLIFPTLKELNIEKYELNELLSTIENIFLMKKYNFTEISKETGVDLKSFIKSKSIKNQKKQKIYFYLTNKDQKQVYFYELEREKLITVFEKEEKLQKKDILKIFSPIIHTELELRLFLDTLIKLGHIKGYYSKLGYFYPYNYIKLDLLDAFHNNG
ncbi:MAG: hypothetical protein ACFE8G_03480, partial [Candidatus Hermodarchaeota archaeon]